MEKIHIQINTSSYEKLTFDEFIQFSYYTILHSVIFWEAVQILHIWWYILLIRTKFMISPIIIKLSMFIFELYECKHHPFILFFFLVWNNFKILQTVFFVIDVMEQISGTFTWKNFVKAFLLIKETSS